MSTGESFPFSNIMNGDGAPLGSTPSGQRKGRRPRPDFLGVVIVDLVSFGAKTY